MVIELDVLRKRIDKIDRKLCGLLEERFELSGKFGLYKKKKGFIIEDKKREEEIIKLRAQESNLPKGFVRKFFGLIFDESKKIQEKVK